MPLVLAFLWKYRLVVLGLLAGAALAYWLAPALAPRATQPPLTASQERRTRAAVTKAEQAAARDTTRAGRAARAAAPAYTAGQQAATQATRLHRLTHAPATPRPAPADSAAERLQRQLAAY